MNPSTGSLGETRAQRTSSVEAREESATGGKAASDYPDGRARSFGYLMLIVGLTVIWGALMHQFGAAPIYRIMGPYAAGVSVLLVALHGHALRARLRPSLRHVLLGLAVGGGMTLLTYPAFAAAKWLFPELVSHVDELYRQAQSEQLAVALAEVIIILTAEELLWRGAWYEAWCPRVGPLRAGALSVASYALTQLCSGSFIVLLLALCCGTVWTVLRHHSRSLVPSLIAHLIWTPTVILLVPVNW